MYVPGVSDPIFIYYDVDSQNNIYVGLVHTTILFRTTHDAATFYPVCRHCRQRLHSVSDANADYAGGTGLRCWGPQSRSKPTCPEVPRLASQAELGLTFYPQFFSLTETGQPSFTKGIVEAYTRRWPVFEQTLTLLEVEADVRESVARVHHALDARPIASMHESLLEEMHRSRRERKFQATVKSLEKTYLPRVLV